MWSFGCVLYECLSGKQTFRGETMSDTVAAILQIEPDWSALPPHTPPRIRELLGRWLEKDLKGRPRDLGDARLEIERTLAGREWSMSATQTAEVFQPPASPRPPGSDPAAERCTASHS